MRAWLQKWWPLFKAVFALAIVVAIGWRFARDLREPALWRRSFHPGWLVLSGVLYVLGLGSSVVFWYRLLRATGQQPSVPAVIRAYYIGLLGKYLPGKAWALLVRAALARGPRVRLGVAGFTAFYEVLTTMATGVLLSAILFAVFIPPTTATLEWPILRRLFTKDAPEGLMPDRRSAILLSVILLLLIAIPLIPALFNRVVQRLSSLKRISREPGEPVAPPLPHLPLIVLPEGMLITSCGWLLIGTSLWALLQGVLVQPMPWMWDVWLRLTASLALAYVAGFIILLVPSGIGVREVILLLFLVPELGPLLGPAEAKPVAVLAVLLLRIVWTAAEAIVAALVWWLPGPSVGTASALNTGP